MAGIGTQITPYGGFGGSSALSQIQPQTWGAGTLFTPNVTNVMSNPMALVPRLTQSETDTHHVISLDVPGIRKEDVTVEMAGDTLVVRGERKAEKIFDDALTGTRRSEKVFGTFQRQIPVGGNALEDKVEAKLIGGILTVKVEKRTKGGATKRITIT